MTQAEFNQMLQTAIAGNSIGGYYTSKWSGEEIDRRLGNVLGPTHNLNLMENWYFGPGVICQAGNTTATSNSNGKLVDRWSVALFTGGSASITDEGLHLVPGTYEGLPYCWIEQKSEVVEAKKLIPGQDMRFTVLLSDGNLISGHGVVPANWLDGTVPPFPQISINFQVDINTGNIQVLGPLSFTWKNIGYLCTRIAFRNEITILAVKLEVGTEQTLARQDASGGWVLNAPPPNRTLEMLKCQRYQIQFVNHDRRDSYGLVGIAFGSTAESNTVAIGGIPVPVNIRFGGTISQFTGSWRLVPLNKNWIDGIPVTNLVVGSSSNLFLSISVKTNSTLTVGQPYLLTYIPPAGTALNSLIYDANI